MEISKSKISVLSSLVQKKHRMAESLFMAEGSKCVMDTLPFFNLEYLVATENWLECHVHNVDSSKILTASKDQIRKISHLSSSGEVVAVYHMPSWQPDYGRVKTELTLLLDGLQDPGNMGTIIRLADWFGIHQIFCSYDTVDVFNPKCVQASMGAISRVKVFYVDLIDLVNDNQEIPLYGTFLDGDDIYETQLSSYGFIVMGNEGNGISPRLSKLITNRLFIPSYPKGEETSESLNVGIATAITVAEFRRRTS